MIAINYEALRKTHSEWSYSAFLFKNGACQLLSKFLKIHHQIYFQGSATLLQGHVILENSLFFSYANEAILITIYIDQLTPRH